MEKDYPGILERIKAITFDNVILVILFFLASNILDTLNVDSTSVKVSLFVLIVFLFEPIFLSVLGATIGQFIVGIRVKREDDENRNIQFHYALLRYLVKMLLGIISFMVVSNNQKGKAIHDYLVGSIVRYKE